MIDAAEKAEYCLNYAGCKVVEKTLIKMLILCIALTMRDVKRCVLDNHLQVILYCLNYAGCKAAKLNKYEWAKQGIALTMRDVKISSNQSPGSNQLVLP